MAIKATQKLASAPRSRKQKKSVNSGILYGANLKVHETAEARIAAVRQEFADAVSAAGTPRGACLMVTTVREERTVPSAESSNNLRRMFFSPVAVSLVPRLIARYGATPCEPPTRDDATLLFGAEGDFALLRHDSH